MTDQLQDFRQFMKRRESGAGARSRGSDTFESEVKGDMETLHTAASHGIAYWVGLQRSKAHQKESDLRITEVFRREGDDWKLVHRHADTLLDKHGV